MWYNQATKFNSEISVARFREKHQGLALLTFGPKRAKITAS